MENFGKLTSGPVVAAGVDRRSRRARVHGHDEEAASPDDRGGEHQPAPVRREGRVETPPEPFDRPAERAVRTPPCQANAARAVEQPPGERLPIRRPARQRLLVRRVRQPCQGAVVERQQIDVARAVAGGMEGEGVPVGRGRGAEILMVVGREPLLLAAGHRHPIELRRAAQVAVVVQQLPVGGHVRVLHALVAARHLDRVAEVHGPAAEGHGPDVSHGAVDVVRQAAPVGGEREALGAEPDRETLGRGAPAGGRDPIDVGRPVAIGDEIDEPAIGREDRRVIDAGACRSARSWRRSARRTARASSPPGCRTARPPW